MRCSGHCKKNETLFPKEYFNQHFTTVRKMTSAIWLLLDMYLYKYETTQKEKLRKLI
jgi:hypothetical protein